MADPAHPPILVVDDNPDNAHIIRDYLEARGYPITVAYNGDEALKAFEEVKPALVLLDVMMPGRDGWQVCREIKQHPTLGRNVRVVMVTALDDWINKRQALQTGADDFVEKPFELSKLASTVERNIKLLIPASASCAWIIINSCVTRSRDCPRLPRQSTALGRQSRIVANWSSSTSTSTAIQRSRKFTVGKNWIACWRRLAKPCGHFSARALWPPRS